MQPIRGHPEMTVADGTIIIMIDAPDFGPSELKWDVAERVLKVSGRNEGPGFRLTVLLPVRVRPGVLLARCNNGIHEVRLEPADRGPEDSESHGSGSPAPTAPSP